MKIHWQKKRESGYAEFNAAKSGNWCPTIAHCGPMGAGLAFDPGGESTRG
jgi:hypothetical protein